MPKYSSIPESVRREWSHYRWHLEKITQIKMTRFVLKYYNSLNAEYEKRRNERLQKKMSISSTL